MAKKILLVEDSALDARIVGETFTKDGFDVHTAATIEEGFKKAKEIMPDLILLDLLLPDGSGFELCSRVRKEGEWGKRVLIVVLSIKSKKDDIEKAFDSGADDYVIKPPSPEFLLKKIRLYLRS